MKRVKSKRVQFDVLAKTDSGVASALGEFAVATGTVKATSTAARRKKTKPAGPPNSTIVQNSAVRGMMRGKAVNVKAFLNRADIPDDVKLRVRKIGLIRGYPSLTTRADAYRRMQAQILIEAAKLAL